MRELWMVQVLTLPEEDKPAAPVRPARRRDERPKNNPKEDYSYRIKGLEQTKLEPGMTRQDVEALDRVIVKLKQKLAEQKD